VDGGSADLNKWRSMQRESEGRRGKDGGIDGSISDSLLRFISPKGVHESAVETNQTSSVCMHSWRVFKQKKVKKDNI